MTAEDISENVQMPGGTLSSTGGCISMGGKGDRWEGRTQRGGVHTEGISRFAEGDYEREAYNTDDGGSRHSNKLH